MRGPEMRRALLACSVVLVLAGHRDSSDAAIDRLGWLNRSSAAEASDTWTPATRAIVAATYRRDFDLLGYAA